MMMENFTDALSLAFDPVGLLIMLAATFLGMVVGALPGLGTVTALAMVLPFTFVLSQPADVRVEIPTNTDSSGGRSVRAKGIGDPGPDRNREGSGGSR